MTARIMRALGSLAALAAATCLLAWGTVAPVTAIRAGTPTFDDLLALAAATVGWLVLGWLVAVLALTALGAAPGALGRLAVRAGRRIAPAAARRLAAVAIGLSVAAGSATSCTTAPDDQLASAAAVPVAAQPFDPTTLPTVGRPGELLSTGAVEPTASSTSPAPASYGAAGAAAAAGLTSEPVREQPPDSSEVVVRRGDSLWTIAARHLGPDATDADIAAEWPRWHAANRDVVGDDPDLILPGMILRPPAS